MNEEGRGKESYSERTKQGEPYEWERCTIRLSVTLFPDDGRAGGRLIVLGCNTHAAPPLIETVREAELGALPPAILSLLDKLKARLPRQAEMAEAKRQIEIGATERAKIKRQIADEEVKTLPQAVAIDRADTKSEASSLENHSGTREPVGSKQQSLFG